MKNANEMMMVVATMADAKRDAMRATMLTAKVVDIPAFVKAVGLLRVNDRHLLDGFMKSFSIYQHKYAVLEAAKNDKAEEAVEAVFNKLLGINSWYRSYTEDAENGNEGDRIFMKRVRTIVDKEAALEDIRRYMSEYSTRVSLYMGDDHYEQ